jgi:YVTN family beta-propeller protein
MHIPQLERSRLRRVSLLGAALFLAVTGSRGFAAPTNGASADFDAPDTDLGAVTSPLAESPARFAGASYSSPIAVTPDDRFVWVCNPDNDSVSLLEVDDDANVKIAEVRVGHEPTNLAISPDGKFVYVSNTGSGTVSVIRARGDGSRVVDTIRVGTEPYGLAFTPNGKRLYVANARSNTVSVIDPKERQVVETIDGVGLEPRGIAITNDGDRKDGDEKVYVTQFLGVDRPGVLVGRDDYKEGRVTVISVRDNRVLGQVVLNPIANTGFKSNGSALGHVAPTDPPTFTFVTGAFPNQLNAIAIHGDRAYVPNTGASSDGPVRFNVNVQSLLSVIDLRTDVEGQVAGRPQTLNMNRGINFETAGPNKLFLASPWAIAFEHGHDVGWAVSLASNVVVKVDVDSAGTPTIHAPLQAGDPGAIVRILVGQSPEGIAINSRDDRAYVMNAVSRDVSVIDLGTRGVFATVASAALPDPGSEAATILLGKALFNSSTGVNLPQLGPQGVVPARLSSEGWSACVACHPNGLTDGVVWIFASGPRRTLPLNGSFNPGDPNDIKLLNHSAIFDEVQDFELNIRNVSGGKGLITQADGVTPDPIVRAFDPANTGRSPLLDALTTYVARGIRSPIAPQDGGDKGRKLFERANCAACHGGGGWASSRRDFTPPPAAGDIVNGQLVRFLKQVGTFDAAAPNEIRANGAPALGAAGFNPPSLLGAFALGPYLHSGSALTIEDVLANVTHRSAGTGGVDLFTRPKNLQHLATFVKSIDASTRPFPITSLATGPVPQTAPGTEVEAAASQLALEPGPNPAHTFTRLAYALPKEGRVRLEIYDANGRRVAQLVDAVQKPGRYEAAWNGHAVGETQAAAGIYFARLQTAAGVITKKLVVAR